MSFATSTVTAAEATALYVACGKLMRSIQEMHSGECPPTSPRRNTLAEVDTLVGAVTTAITAVNA